MEDKKQRQRERDREQKRERYKTDEAFRNLKREKSRERKRQLRQQKIDAGVDIKPRGRPRKTYGGLKNVDELLLVAECRDFNIVCLNSDAV